MKKSFSDPEYVGKSLKPDTDNFSEGSFDHYLLLNTKMNSRLILSTSVGRDDIFAGIFKVRSGSNLVFRGLTFDLLHFSSITASVKVTKIVIDF